jgi:hypothetical protein
VMGVGLMNAKDESSVYSADRGLLILSS